MNGDGGIVATKYILAGTELFSTYPEHWNENSYPPDYAPLLHHYRVADEIVRDILASKRTRDAFAAPQSKQQVWGK